MARIRSIKPEFWTSAQVLECSPNARLLFIGLWNFCDDLGRHPYSPKQCKAEVFPADPFTEDEITAMLLELEKNYLIEVYGHDYGDVGMEYFCVTGWKHQRIDKPQPAKYPGPTDEGSEPLPHDPFLEPSASILGPLPPDRIGKDRIGEDKKGEDIDKEVVVKQPQKKKRTSETARGTRLLGEWLPSPDSQLYGVGLLGEDGVARAVEDFKDYWLAKPGKDGLKLDWERTWKKWCRNAKDWKGNGNGQGRSRPLQDDRLSASRAAERLAGAAKRGEFSFGPRPRLSAPEGEADILMLPKGRSA